MQLKIMQHHWRTLKKRYLFLTRRIEESTRDLSFDKAEKAAIDYAVLLIEKDIEEQIIKERKELTQCHR